MRGRPVRYAMTSHTPEEPLTQTPIAPRPRVPLRERLGNLVVMLCSVLGLIVCGILLQHHLAIVLGRHPLLAGICDISPRASCDEVLSSQWGTFYGLPTAMWGFFFFAVMFAWSLAVGRVSGSRRGWHLVPVVLSAAGTGICGGLAYLMYTQLPRYCPLCAIVHGLTALIFLAVLASWPRRAPDAAESGAAVSVYEASQPRLRHLVTAVVLALTISFAGLSEFGRHNALAKAAVFYQRWQSYEQDYQAVYHKFIEQPQVSIPVLPEDSVRGDRSAPHTVVMFGDFQCEHCRRAHKLLDEKLQQNPGRFRIVFKHYPMNSSCNPGVRARVHMRACEAAQIAEAAWLMGGDELFWKMHDELFENQRLMGQKPEEFKQAAAAKLGISLDELQQHIHTPANWDRVKQLIQQGRNAGIRGTPAVFYDNREVVGWQNGKFWDFLMYIDKQSQKRTVTAPAR